MRRLAVLTTHDWPAIAGFSQVVLLTFTVRNYFNTGVCAVLLGVASIGVANLVAAQVEHLTRQQCLSKDWPASAHAEHVDFCKTYGYPTR